jgi:hypothetical protein
LRNWFDLQTAMIDLFFGVCHLSNVNFKIEKDGGKCENFQKKFLCFIPLFMPNSAKIN